MKFNFRLGTDPEYFLARVIPDLLPEHVTVCGRIGADKHNPMPLKSLGKGFAIQEDNVAVEFCVPPTNNPEEMFNNLKRVRKAPFELLELKGKFKGLSISPSSTHTFQKLDDPRAFIFGCDPDYNAWTREVNPTPIPPTELFRSCGGHVHIETDLDPWLVGRACDVTLGLGSVITDVQGRKRRPFYGRAGAMRLKPYGLEYRVLSNYWTFSYSGVMEVYQGVERALDLVRNQVDIEPFGDAIQEAINSGSAAKCRSLMGLA